MASAELVVERAAADSATPAIAADAVAAPAEATPRRRSAVRLHESDELGGEAQALLAEAAALVRTAALDAVASAADGGDAAVQRARRDGARDVKRKIRVLNSPKDGPPLPFGKKAAKLSRIYAILFDLALREGTPTQSVRWPDGVDMADALADLIRVLSAPPRVAADRMPDIAEEAELAIEPDPSRLPEIE